MNTNTVICWQIQIGIFLVLCFLVNKKLNFLRSYCLDQYEFKYIWVNKNSWIQTQIWIFKVLFYNSNTNVSYTLNKQFILWCKSKLTIYCIITTFCKIKENNALACTFLLFGLTECMDNTIKYLDFFWQKQINKYLFQIS